MRAVFTDEQDSNGFDLTYSNSINRRWQREAARRGMTVPALIEQGIKSALDAGLEPPPKEGRVVPFKALKSSPGDK